MYLPLNHFVYAQRLTVLHSHHPPCAPYVLVPLSQMPARDQSAVGPARPPCLPSPELVHLLPPAQIVTRDHKHPFTTGLETDAGQPPPSAVHLCDLPTQVDHAYLTYTPLSGCVINVRTHNVVLRIIYCES